MIHEWMDADQYDPIFLATEDQDILGGTIGKEYEKPQGRIAIQ